MVKPTEKNPVAEQKKINKRLKKKKMTKQFGDASVNFSGTVECNLCGVKVGLIRFLFIIKQSKQML